MTVPVTAPVTDLSWVFYAGQDEVCDITIPEACSLEAVAIAWLRLACLHLRSPMRLCVPHKDRMEEQLEAAAGRVTCPGCGALVVVVKVERIR